jgi:hypothetical protein
MFDNFHRKSQSVTQMDPGSGTDGETEFLHCTYNSVRSVTERHRNCYPEETRHPIREQVQVQEFDYARVRDNFPY